jgi:SHOCT-like protein
MTTQTDDTRRILDMLSQGKITVDEADRLIKAMSADRPAEIAAADTATDARARMRWFRINIHKPAKDETHKPKDVNIRVPIAVVKGGMRLGAIIATFAGEKAAQRMKERGLDLDLSTINGDLSRMNGAEFDTFLKTLDDMNIEIDDGKSQVRITAE